MKRMYVGNLPFSSKEEDVRELFFLNLAKLQMLT